MQTARTLWLIPARSGSKGLPHKNICDLGGRPLLAWRIASALPLVGNGSALWLSTDSDEYAQIGKKFGAEVPFVRPPDLSSDTATSISVCLHAMAFASHLGQSFDYIGLLQPTSPFVTTQSLKRALASLAADDKAHAAVAVRKVTTPSLFIQPHMQYLNLLAERMTTLMGTRRQDMPEEITPCGGIYIAKWDLLLKNPTFYAQTTIPILLEEKEVIDIDTEEDMLFARYLVMKNSTHDDTIFP